MRISGIPGMHWKIVRRRIVVRLAYLESGMVRQSVHSMHDIAQPHKVVSDPLKQACVSTSTLCTQLEPQSLFLRFNTRRKQLPGEPRVSCRQNPVTFKC